MGLGLLSGLRARATGLQGFIRDFIRSGFKRRSGTWEMLMSFGIFPLL